MFRFSGFTGKANNAINVALAQASLLGHTYVGSEHLVLGMLDENSGVAYAALTQKSVTFEIYKKSIVSTVGSGEKTNLTPEDFTPRCRKMLEISMMKARMMGRSRVGTEHILMALAKEPDSYGVKLLRELGADPEPIVGSIMDSMGDEADEAGAADRRFNRTRPMAPPRQQPSKTPTLDKYSRDLTEFAAADKLDPVFGREDEIKRVIQILTRRTKNNPCLIGEAGVGKTAIVEGLAQRIIRGETPEPLRGKRVLAVDLAAMVAGAKYRGDFEERIKTSLEEAAADRDAILFIDELHTIIGAGAAEGAIDAANILKPQLARGGIQIIGATTTAEYRRYIEKEAALERRFQSVMVEQPEEADAIMILRGLRPKYEEHHKVIITDGAIEAAVKLSARYMSERMLPDKAIDLLDEASSKLKLKAFDAKDSLCARESRLYELKAEKENAVNAKNFELASSIHDREKALRAMLGRYGTDLGGEKRVFFGEKREELTGEDVAVLISEITGIELASLSEEESRRLMNLEERLRERVIGQPEAVSAVTSAIRRGKAGLKEPGRPIGSFIFLGPTGVGKTELCVALSECMFTKSGALIRLDMSEYMEKHAVARLIGSPPGYVGYEEGGQLTEKIRRRPYSVVLFDEIEKAHPEVFNILLQILEEGTLTDAQGHLVSFKNSVVIMTSNAGARHFTENRSMGFTTPSAASEPDSGDSGTADRGLRREVMSELKRILLPELINRVDEIVVFNRLKSEEIRKIARLAFQRLAKKAAEMNIALEFSDSAVEKIAERGFDPVYGARPLRRAVQQHVEDKLADEILAGGISPGENVLCDYQDGFVFLKQEKAISG